jgi:hypothetical protein
MEGIAKYLGKTAAQLVPFAGQGLSLTLAGIRASRGDNVGAVLEAVGAIPVLGIASNLVLMLHDYLENTDPEAEKKAEIRREEARVRKQKFVESLNDAYQVQAGLMPDSLKPLPTPESNSTKKLLEQTNQSNENKLTPAASGKVSVIDNSRIQTTAMKGKDDIVYGNRVNARNDDPTLSWIIQKSTRQV